MKYGYRCSESRTKVEDLDRIADRGLGHNVLPGNYVAGAMEVNSGPSVLLGEPLDRRSSTERVNQWYGFKPLHEEIEKLI